MPEKKVPSGEITTATNDKTRLAVTGLNTAAAERPFEPAPFRLVLKMLRYNIGRLPVVDRVDPRKILGYLGRPGVMAARLRKFNDEYVREPGWFRGFRRTTR
jgi:hypothetical protein